MKTNDIWDKNWVERTDFEFHPELISLIRRYARGNKILEVGFGSAGDLISLNKFGFKCFGLEKSKIAYTRAKNNKQIKVLFGDGEQAPFGNEQFDLIFHQGLLEHFKEPRKLLSEQWRMLKNNGIVVIDVPHKWNIFTIYKKFYQLFGKWYGGWERSYSASELKQLLRISGFKPLEVFYRGIFPHQWSKILFPEKIIKNKFVKKILTRSPIKYFQKGVRLIYDKSKFLQLVSSYNVIIVAKKI